VTCVGFATSDAKSAIGGFGHRLGEAEGRPNGKDAGRGGTCLIKRLINSSKSGC
jgi:chemotaxis receptor (MCP) glutamine deamidase CheD